jgi:hypothetical protein
LSGARDGNIDIPCQVRGGDVRATHLDQVSLLCFHCLEAWQGPGEVPHPRQLHALDDRGLVKMDMEMAFHLRGGRKRVA